MACKYLAYFVLNLFACLKQLAAAHPPHTQTHTHKHTHGLAVNALINVFRRAAREGGLKAKTVKCQAPPKAKRHLHKCRADVDAATASLHVIER